MDEHRSLARTSAEHPPALWWECARRVTGGHKVGAGDRSALWAGLAKHLGRLEQECRRDGEAEGLGGLEVDH
jgi:hypothetical protein